MLLLSSDKEKEARIGPGLKKVLNFRLFLQSDNFIPLVIPITWQDMKEIVLLSK